MIKTAETDFPKKVELPAKKGGIIGTVTETNSHDPRVLFALYEEARLILSLQLNNRPRKIYAARAGMEKKFAELHRNGIAILDESARIRQLEEKRCWNPYEFTQDEKQELKERKEKLKKIQQERAKMLEEMAKVQEEQIDVDTTIRRRTRELEGKVSQLANSEDCPQPLKPELAKFQGYLSEICSRMEASRYYLAMPNSEYIAFILKRSRHWLSRSASIVSVGGKIVDAVNDNVISKAINLVTESSLAKALLPSSVVKFLRRGSLDETTISSNESIELSVIKAMPSSVEQLIEKVSDGSEFSEAWQKKIAGEDGSIETWDEIVRESANDITLRFVSRGFNFGRLGKEEQDVRKALSRLSELLSDERNVTPNKWNMRVSAEYIRVLEKYAKKHLNDEPGLIKKLHETHHLLNGWANVLSRDYKLLGSSVNKADYRGKDKKVKDQDLPEEVKEMVVRLRNIRAVLKPLTTFCSYFGSLSFVAAIICYVLSVPEVATGVGAPAALASGTVATVFGAIGAVFTGFGVIPRLVAKASKKLWAFGSFDGHLGVEVKPSSIIRSIFDCVKRVVSFANIQSPQTVVGQIKTATQKTIGFFQSGGAKNIAKGLWNSAKAAVKVISKIFSIKKQISKLPETKKYLQHRAQEMGIELQEVKKPDVLSKVGTVAEVPRVDVEAEKPSAFNQSIFESAEGKTETPRFTYSWQCVDWRSRKSGSFFALPREEEVEEQHIAVECKS